MAKADKTETLSIDDLEEDKDKDTEKTEIEKGIAEGSRSILFPDEKPKNDLLYYLFNLHHKYLLIFSDKLFII